MVGVNEKYTDILVSGKELFWKFGIKKVSIEEICKNARSSRVTFYKYFSNKEKLALCILKNVIEDAFIEYEKIIHSTESFKTKAEKTIQFKIERTGDISAEFLNDIYSGDYRELSEYMNAALNRNLENFRKDYSRAQLEGNIRSDLKIDFLIYFLNKLTGMISDPEFLSMYNNPGEAIAEAIRFFFYGVMPRQDEGK